MNNPDLPQISNHAATSSTYNLGAGGIGGVGPANTVLVGHQDVARRMQAQQLPYTDHPYPAQDWQQQALKLSSALKQAQAVKDVAMTQRRLVQVFIVDPDENVPLDKSLIYSGEQKLTDATNEELFHEIEINRILKEHNAYRISLVNKKVKERTENLEPARIRDLSMVVAEIAKF